MGVDRKTCKRKKARQRAIRNRLTIDLQKIQRALSLLGNNIPRVQKATDRKSLQTRCKLAKNEKNGQIDQPTAPELDTPQFPNFETMPEKFPRVRHDHTLISDMKSLKKP